MSRFARFALAWLASLLLLAGMWTIWQIRGSRQVSHAIRIPSIMGTATSLKAILPADQASRGASVLSAAERALRAVEERMSDWVGTTEIGRFNRAPAHAPLPISEDTAAVIRQALELSERTDGAFDITCRPLVRLWREASKQDREPTPAERAEALARTGWRKLRLEGLTLEKLAPGVEIDLGGIAKGFAVDRAIEAMQKLGAEGGLVQCGGDLRVFGPTEHSEDWFVARPEDSVALDAPDLPRLRIRDRAVSTSGMRERSLPVAGRKRSHIVDPRTGEPTDHVPQVTVLAPRCVISDGWSTALSVLGPSGLSRLPEGVEAILRARLDGRLQTSKTPGFPE